MPGAILTQWDGQAFVPATRHMKKCDAEYTVGETYFVDPIAPRSQASHNHFFAQLADLWLNLPEDQAERWPNAEALRKYALIMTGYRDERTIVASSKAEAQRIAAFVRPMDETAVVTVKEAVVRVWTAKSQSMKAMGKSDFQKSKDDVLGYVAGLIGVTAQEAQENAGRAA